MSRRRRPRPAEASGGGAAPAAAPPKLPALSRPITVDPSQLEISDIPLMLKLQSADGRSEAELEQLIFEMVPMLERLVVGGLGGFKLSELAAVIQEVFSQLKQAGNPGN